MSASDHLSRAQFMPAEEIGKMGSQYTDPATGSVLSVQEAYHRPDLRFGADEDQHAQNYGRSNARAYHEELRAHIRQHGVQNPITFHTSADAADMIGEDNVGDFSAAVLNGHHRYYAGLDEGVTRFPVTPYVGVKDPKVEGWDK